jgi:hypothetical protein
VSDQLRVPEPAEIQKSLTMLLGCEVTVADAGPEPPSGAIPVAVGSFPGDGAALRGCAWVDLGLGAAMGAAMSMTDRTGADECLVTGVLPTEFQANLREVLTVTGGLLGDGEIPPQLRELELLEIGLAEDTLALLADPRRAGFYQVEVAEYGSGLLSFTLA